MICTSRLFIWAWNEFLLNVGVRGLFDVIQNKEYARISGNLATMQIGYERVGDVHTIGLHRGADRHSDSFVMACANVLSPNVFNWGPLTSKINEESAFYLISDAIDQWPNSQKLQIAAFAVVSENQF